MTATLELDSRMPSLKQYYLDNYELEHQITMKVLRAFPTDQIDFRPHPKCRTARELAWTFVMERGLGVAVFNNQLAQLMSGEPPAAPDSWDEILADLENAHRDFAKLVEDTPEDALLENVQFFTGPKTMGDVRRIDWIWFLLKDEIHHRGQLSIYLRMVDAKVPSIYGPTADEPWS